MKTGSTPDAEATLEAHLDQCERRFRALDEKMRVLERERQKLSAVVNHTDAGFLTFDHELRVVWTNVVFQSRFWSGRGTDSPLGLPCQRVLCMRASPCEGCPAKQSFTSGSVAHHELHLSLSGRPSHVYATAIPIRSLEGTIDETIVMLQDVSGLEVLRQSEARKGAILETALDAILSFDERGSITEFNRTAEEMFGYARAEALGTDVARLVLPPAPARSLGSEETLGRRLETTATRRDGRSFPVEIAITRVPLGESPLFTGYVRDLSQRRAAESALRDSEERLRQAQKMEAVGRLAGGIAHDFNNLLTAISGYGELTLRDLREQDAVHSNLTEILNAAQRASTLTRQLLAFSRRQVLETRVLNLNSVVEGLFAMLQRLIGEDVELAQVLDPDLPAVKADPGQIEQVIMNLAVNARDAMPRGGRLVLTTRGVDLDSVYVRQHVPLQPGSYVMLAVSDNGTGMDEETRARVFEPFFTTKMQGKGTGLGLATVYGIVKQSGGYIWVYSESGSGTTFKIYLPRVLERVPDPEPPKAPLSSMLGTETILVVEDEDLIRSLAREVLEGQGYRVLDAHDGVEALSVAERYEGVIHLVLTDVVMPLMSGRELAERVTRLRPQVRVLFMSGYTGDMLPLQSELWEGAAYLEKPFSLLSLTRKVREVLSEVKRSAR